MVRSLDVVDTSRSRAAAARAHRMRKGSCDKGGVASMDVRVLNDQRRCDECGRTGLLAWDCWQGKEGQGRKAERRLGRQS